MIFLDLNVENFVLMLKTIGIGHDVMKRVHLHVSCNQMTSTYRQVEYTRIFVTFILSAHRYTEANCDLSSKQITTIFFGALQFRFQLVLRPVNIRHY
jgi:hypothetical protein